MGDFNSRTGKYSDTISKEGNSIISNDQSESAFQPTQRYSFDNVLRGSLPKSGPLDFATKNYFPLFFVGEEALVGVY